MGSALRILLGYCWSCPWALAPADAEARWTGLSPTYPEAKADPSTKMSKAPARRLWIDKLLE